jgi:hypothetical protein
MFGLMAWLELLCFDDRIIGWVGGGRWIIFAQVGEVGEE